MTKSTNNQINLEAPEPCYYARIPNVLYYLGLGSYEISLYVYLKRVTGAGNRICFQKTELIAENSGMSAGSVSNAKRTLSIAGLINLELRKPRDARGRETGNETHHITVRDIWELNIAYFDASAPGHEQAQQTVADIRRKVAAWRALSRREQSRRWEVMLEETRSPGEQVEQTHSPDERARSPGELTHSPGECKNNNIRITEEEQQQIPKAQSNDDNGKDDSVVVALLSLGLPKGLIEAWQQIHGIERIRQVMTVSNRKTIGNRAGWIREALENEWVFDIQTSPEELACGGVYE